MPQQDLIAVVDDDESLRTAIHSLLRSMGFDVEVFPSAEAFLGSESLGHTACLISDIQMPGTTGLDLHRELTASGATIPTILITGYPDERLRTDSPPPGVLCYLTKPFEDNDLLACLRSILGRPERTGSENAVTGFLG